MKTKALTAAQIDTLGQRRSDAPIVAAMGVRGLVVRCGGSGPGLPA